MARLAKISWKWEDKLGEGTFKEAYMTKVEGQGDYYGHKPGTKLVKFIKPERYKSIYKSGVRITEKDVGAQKLAQQYAKRFQKEHRPHKGGEPIEVFFRVAQLISSSQD